ncbi:hypothetical protein LP419_32255 [Massilia sp. H-1]|nr:hypothetical protein LP419_32255 [Massilia sp. H-1]
MTAPLTIGSFTPLALRAQAEQITVQLAAIGRHDRRVDRDAGDAGLVRLGAEGGVVDAAMPTTPSMLAPVGVQVEVAIGRVAAQRVAA